MTTDPFFGGRLEITQPREGYRFSLDAPVLAAHITPRENDRILELGTGCGIVSLLIGLQYPDVEIHALEIQPDLADLAGENVTKNRISDRVRIYCGDLRAVEKLDIPLPVDQIVSNPPYRSAGAGRINPDNQRAVARHEIEMTLRDLAATARKTLRTGGRITLIYQCERMGELIDRFRRNGLEPKSLRFVHTDRQSVAKIFVLEAVKGGRPGVTIRSPLFVYQAPDEYSDEMAGIFGETPRAGLENGIVSSGASG